MNLYKVTYNNNAYYVAAESYKDAEETFLIRVDISRNPTITKIEFIANLYISKNYK